MTKPSAPRANLWQPRFGLASLMLFILVCCMMAAAGRHLVAGLSASKSARAVFVIFVLTLPVLLLIALNAFHQLTSWLRHRR